MKSADSITVIITYVCLYNIIFSELNCFVFFINKFDEKQMHLKINKSIWDGIMLVFLPPPPSLQKILYESLTVQINA